MCPVSNNGTFEFSEVDFNLLFRCSSGLAPAGGMVDLGAPYDFDSAIAYATNQDGSIVVGQATGALGMTAFYWTAANGMQQLQDVWQAKHLPFPNLEAFWSANGVST